MRKIEIRKNKMMRLDRLAYSRRETAEVLGLSEITIQRLEKRGLLRSSPHVRHKRYARVELERFLCEIKN